MLKRVLLCVSLFVVPSAFAATFTVTSSNPTGAGSLSQAISSANATPGADRIVFAVETINATSISSFPDITDPVTIDGTVSGGKVTITGEHADCTRLFNFRAGSSGSTVSDVITNGFCEGVRIDAGVTGVTITRMTIEYDAYVIGDDNVMTDNSIRRLDIVDGARNLVLRNTISQVVVQGFSLLQAALNNRIGGPGNGNTITGSIWLFAARGTIVEGNVLTHAGPLPSGTGIDALGGGAMAWTIRANTISGFETGIAVGARSYPQPLGVEITQNVFSNVGIAIDLGDNGPTPNDPAPDADFGENNLQNYPVLTSAVTSPTQVTVAGSLASVPSTTFRIEVFAGPDTNSTPAQYLGAFNVTTDATGNVTFNSTVGTPASATSAVTATATNLSTHDTSEFSAPVAVDAPGQLGFASSTANVNESAGTITLAVQRTGGSEGTVTVAYSTANGTATAPADYTTTSGTLTFGPGVTTQNIVVPIVNDAMPELAETFTVTLSNPTGGATLGTATTTVTINAQLPPEALPTMSQWTLIALALSLCAVALMWAR